MTYYVSLGHDCIVTDILIYGGLRDVANVFDYVYAFPCHIRHALDTDFKYWIDEEYLTLFYSPFDKRTGTNHSLYSYHTDKMNKKYKFICGFFHHHNLFDPEIRKSFEKRILRYRNMISSEENIIFLTNSKIKDIKEYGIDKYYNRKAKTIIVYLHDSGYGEYDVKLKKINDDWILFYKYPEKVLGKGLTKKPLKVLGPMIANTLKAEFESSAENRNIPPTNATK